MWTLFVLIMNMQILQCIHVTRLMFYGYTKYEHEKLVLLFCNNLHSSCHLFLLMIYNWNFWLSRCDVFLFFLDRFENSSGMDDDNLSYKQCNSTPTKSNKSNGLMHASIGLAIVAILIVVLYLYTHLLKRYQIPTARV